MVEAKQARAQELKAQIGAQGFVRVGIAKADLLEPEREQLSAWLAQGYHAQMKWMAETADVRVDPRHANMLAEAKSVIVAAFAYSSRAETKLAPPARVARYAHGRDYHRVLHNKLKPALRWLESQGYRARIAVDSKPVMERAWAERAGVGFIGKNSCLIVPGVGSFVFLACIVTDAEFAYDEPMSRRCGSCTACLDACPTRAFVGPRQLDASRCISYLTIEHEGEIDSKFHEPMADWIFGCDTCQEVCPYQSPTYQEGNSISDFISDARWANIQAEDFLTMSESEFDRRFAGSPLRRAGYQNMQRNARLVLHNARARHHLPVL